MNSKSGCSQLSIEVFDDGSWRFYFTPQWVEPVWGTIKELRPLFTEETQEIIVRAMERSIPSLVINEAVCRAHEITEEEECPYMSFSPTYAAAVDGREKKGLGRLILGHTGDGKKLAIGAKDLWFDQLPQFLDCMRRLFVPLWYDKISRVIVVLAARGAVDTHVRWLEEQIPNGRDLLDKARGDRVCARVAGLIFHEMLRLQYWVAIRTKLAKQREEETKNKENKPTSNDLTDVQKLYSEGLGKALNINMPFITAPSKVSLPEPKKSKTQR